MTLKTWSISDVPNAMTLFPPCCVDTSDFYVIIITVNTTWPLEPIFSLLNVY